MRNKLRKQSFSFVIWALLLAFFTKQLFAWTIDTHMLLSDQAAGFSNLESGVLQELGFQNLDTFITGTDFQGTEKIQEIGEWIQDGAEFEDEGSLFTGRFYNHFHNPLLEWPSVKRKLRF